MTSSAKPTFHHALILAVDEVLRGQAIEKELTEAFANALLAHVARAKPTNEILRLAITPNVTEAWLENFNLSLSTLSAFRGTAIRKLQLSDCVIPQGALDLLPEELEDLTLDDGTSVHNYPINDTHIESILAACPKLKRLALPESRISTEKVKELAKRLPELEHLILDRCASIDASALEPFTNLRTLSLIGLPGLANETVEFVCQNKVLESFSASSNPLFQEEALQKLGTLEQLHTLTLPGCEHVSDACLEAWTKLPKLRHLNIARCQGVSDQGIAYLGDDAKLSTLDLSECHSVTGEGFAAFDDDHRLAYLSLRGCKGVTEEGLKKLFGRITIEHLDVSTCFGLTDAALMDLHVRSRDSLHVLDISECEQVTNDGLHFLRDLRHLRTLRCELMEQITDEGFRNLRFATRLRSIDLSWCTAITDQTVNILVGITHLHRIILKQCTQLTDASTYALRHSTQIEELSLADCVLITDTSLRSLQGCTELRHLDLSNCRKITDEGLELLLDHPRLDSLNVNGCYFVTDDPLNRMRNRWPGIQIKH